MSKYALLLQELARACGGPVQELNALQAAQSLVHFQLRHGNDLLAMDAIQGCDVSHPGHGGQVLWEWKKRAGGPGTHKIPISQVNLKEQGQLVRQDEFMVRAGRHKSLRRVFLFEELLLFSKPRRGSTGVDTFTYKRSFKVGSSDTVPSHWHLLMPHPVFWPHRWQTLASLSAVQIANCALRSGFAGARPGTPLCYRLLAWTSSRPGQLTSPACFGGRLFTTRVGACPLHNSTPAPHSQ